MENSLTSRIFIKSTVDQMNLKLGMMITRINGIAKKKFIDIATCHEEINFSASITQRVYTYTVYTNMDTHTHTQINKLVRTVRLFFNTYSPPVCTTLLLEIFGVGSEKYHSIGTEKHKPPPLDPLLLYSLCIYTMPGNYQTAVYNNNTTEAVQVP